LVADTELHRGQAHAVDLVLLGGGGPAGEGVTPQVEATELAPEVGDVTGLAHPVAQEVVQVGDAEVAHAEDVGHAHVPSSLGVHVDVDELVVHRRVAVPVGQARRADERRGGGAGSRRTRHDVDVRFLPATTLDEGDSRWRSRTK
jgi:hypothetical protein